MDAATSIPTENELLEKMRSLGYTADAPSSEPQSAAPAPEPKPEPKPMAPLAEAAPAAPPVTGEVKPEAPHVPTEAELLDKMKQMGLVQQPVGSDTYYRGVQEPAPRPGVGGQFAGDVSRGFSQLKNIGYGLGAWGADALGYEDYANGLLKTYIDNEKKLAEENPAVIGSLENIHNKEDFGRYVVEKLGENVATMIPGMVTGGVGSLIAKRAAVGVAEKMIQDTLAKGFTKEVAEKAAVNYLNKQLATGAFGGALASSVPMETGSIYADTFKETGVKSPMIALALGVPAGALDALEPAMAMKSVLGNTGKGFLRTVGENMATEGATEAAQQAIENVGPSTADGRPYFTKENLMESLNAGAAGAIGGGGFGGAAHVAGKVFNGEGPDPAQQAALAGQTQPSVPRNVQQAFQNIQNPQPPAAAPAGPPPIPPSRPVPPNVAQAVQNAAAASPTTGAPARPDPNAAAVGVPPAGAATAPDGQETVSEPQESIDAQYEQLIDPANPRNALVLNAEDAKGWDLDTVQLDGLDMVDLGDRGAVIFNPDVFSADDVVKAADENRLDQLLGYEQSKQEAGPNPVVVRATRPDGVVTDTAAVSPDRIQAQAETFQQRQPDAALDVTTPEDVLRQRQEQDAADYYAEQTPDVVRYDDGTTQQVMPPRQNVAAEEPAPSPASEQEYWDTYDDYRAEQNTEPTVAYGVGERPVREPQSNMPPAAAAAPPKAAEVLKKTAKPRKKAPKVAPEKPASTRTTNNIPQLSDDGTKSRLKAATARVRNALLGKGKLKTSEVELPIADLVSQQDWIEPSRKEPALATNEPPVVVHVDGKLVVRDGNHRLAAMADRGDKTAKVRLVELDPYGLTQTEKEKKARGVAKTTEKKAAQPAEKPKAPNKKSEAAAPAAQPAPAPEPAKPLGTVGGVHLGILEKTGAKKSETSAAPSRKHVKREVVNAKKDSARKAEQAFKENPRSEAEGYEGGDTDLFGAGNKTEVGSPLVRSEKQRSALKARLQKIVKAVGVENLPGQIRKDTPDHLMYAKVAHDILTKSINADLNRPGHARDALDHFVAGDVFAQQGDFAPMRERRTQENTQGIGTVGMEQQAEVVDPASEDVLDNLESNEFNDDIAADEEGEFDQNRVADYFDAVRKFARRMIKQRRLNLDKLNEYASKKDPELAARYPMKSAREIEDWISNESAKANAPKKAAPKKAKPVTAPVTQKKVISAEENARALAALEEARKRDEAAKAPTPTYDEKAAEFAKRDAAEIEYRRLQGEAAHAQSVVNKIIASGTASDKAMKEAFAELEAAMRALKNAGKRVNGEKPKPVANKFLSQSDAEYSAARLQREEQDAQRQGDEDYATSPTVFQARDWDGNPATFIQDKDHIAEVVETHTVADVVDKALRYGKANPPMMRFVASLVRRLAGDVKVHIVMDQDLQQLSPNSHGYYEGDGNYVVLPYEAAQKSPEYFNQLFIHEALHAALARKLQGNYVASTQIDYLAQTLRPYFSQAGIEWTDYVWQSPHEFISEVFSRGDLQNIMRKVPLSRADAEALGIKDWRGGTMWQGWLAKVAEWLGYKGPTNALDGALSVVDRIVREDVGNIPSVIAHRFEEEFWTHPHDSLRVHPPIAQPSTKYPSRGVINDVTPTVKDRTGSWLNRVKRGYLHMSTLDQIRQDFAGLFTDAKGDVLDRLVATVQKIDGYKAELQEHSKELAQSFAELAQANPQEAERLGELMIDATISDVQLGAGALNGHLAKPGMHNAQGRARIAELQSRFARLTPGAQKIYNDTKKYFRDVQNKQVEAAIHNLLDEAGIQPQNRAAFVNRAINGNMTPQDKALFQNHPVVLKHVMNARKARVIRGDYFPLMRHGNYAVITLDDIVDTMGGKEIAPGKVEFRARSLKDARAQAEKFVQAMATSGNQMPLMSVKQEAVHKGQTDFGIVVHMQRGGLYTFDSEAEANAWARENTGKFSKVSPVQELRNTGLQSTDLSTAQHNSILASIRNNPLLAQDMKDAMEEVFQQAASGLKSGNRIQHRSITRRKVVGASLDYARNLYQYGEASSGNLARSRYMPAIREALDSMDKISERNAFKGTSSKMVEIINEVRSRVNEGALSASEPPRWLQNALAATYLGKLFSPMYSVINGMQPMMVTLPELSRRFNPARAGAAMSDAYRAVGAFGAVKTGLSNTALAARQWKKISIDANDTFGSIRTNVARETDGVQLTEILDELKSRNAMGEGGFDIGPAISRGASLFGRVTAKVDRISRQLPKAVEDINRAVTAIAAYRLARGANMTEEKAKAYAINTVMNTQGLYNASNTPLPFKNNWMRPALQFKNYSQMMIHLTVDMAKQAFAGASPQEKKAGLQGLATLAGVQIIMAGAFSLPGLELIKLPVMLAAALGIGEGWEDLEDKLRRVAEDSFGKTIGTGLTKGLPHLIGPSLSSRLSLADMVTFGEPERYNADGIMKYILDQAIGAPGGTFHDVMEGYDDVTKKGDYLKGISKMIPIKFVADALKGADRYNRGEATVPEMALNAFGAQTGRQADRGREIGMSVRKNKHLEEDRSSLQHRYLNADNPADRARIRVEIAKHNKGAPLRERIFPNALERVRRRIENERVN